MYNISIGNELLPTEGNNFN